MNRLPRWFRQDLSNNKALCTKETILELGLHTVCQEARCPNMNTCFAKKQATFMILGKVCSRHCRFCNVNAEKNIRDQASRANVVMPAKTGIHSRWPVQIPACAGMTLRGAGMMNPPSSGLLEDEPERIVKAVKALGLRYVVITSVTRDDLDDGGAGQFVRVIELLRNVNKDIKVEVLIPDFGGNLKSLAKVVQAHPLVLAHNLETVRRLSSEIRPEADYECSLNLLKKAKELSEDLLTKSSLMLGLGETEEEVIMTLQDLGNVGCTIVTLGQYLAPSAKHYPVKEFISPEQFRRYYSLGRELGFKRVLSGPKARSSYCAEELAGDLTYA